MNSERADQFDRAIRKAKLADEAAQEPPESRYAFIQGSCGNDPQLMSEVLLLLQPFPTSIGPYRPFLVIGVGGMGGVYAAHQEGRPKDFVVAVKVIRFGKESPEMLNRFEQERQNLFRINHPNVVEMKDCGFTEDGRPYFAMRYLEGAVEITEYCKDRPQAEVLAIFSKLCTVLWAVHEQGVVHGDLKPSNILVVNGEPFLLDFGISELLAGDATADELVRMTAFSEWYVAPEILDGSKATRQSDIRALGAVMHECLNGHPPFERQVHDSLQGMIRQLDPRFPAAQPKELRAIVERALRRDPNERYSGADDFRDDIESFLEGRALAPETLKQSALDSLRRWRRRNPSTFWLAATAATSILALGVGGLIAANREHRMSLDLQRQEEKTLASNEYQSAQDALTNRGAREAGVRAIVATNMDRALSAESLLFGVNALLPKTVARFTFDGGVETIAFSAKSDVMVATGKRGQVRLFALPGFRVLYEENCFQSASAAFRADGEQVAVACGPRTIKLLDVHSPKLVRQLSTLGDVTGMKYSPDGKMLAVRAEKQVFLFESGTGRRVATIRHAASVGATQLTFSADSRWLATASKQNPVNIFDAITGKPVAVIPLPAGYTLDFAYPRILEFANENRLFVALNSGLDPARIWTIAKTGQPQASAAIRGVILPLSATLFPARNGSWLYVGMDHVGEAVDIDKSQNHFSIPGEGIEQIRVAGKTGHELQVLTVQRDGTARAWRAAEIADEYREYRRIAQKAPIVLAEIDPDGDFAATADEQGNLQVSDIRIATELKVRWPAIENLKIEGPRYDVYGPSLSPKGSWIARQLSLPFDPDHLKEPGAVEVVRSSDLNRVATLPTYDEHFLDVAFSPKEDRIAWTSMDEVRVASTKTWKQLSTITNLRANSDVNRLRVRFTADGSHLLIICSGNGPRSELRLLDINTGAILAKRMVRGRVTAIEESQTRKELAVGAELPSGGIVHFYREANLEEIRTLEPLKYPPDVIRYSADGRYFGLVLKSGSRQLKSTDAALELIPNAPDYEEDVEVQDADTWRQIVHVSAQSGFVGIAFSDDSRTLRIAGRYIGPVAIQSEGWSGSELVELPSGKKIEESHSSKIRFLKFAAFSRNGKWMAGLDRDSQESTVVNLSDGRLTSEVGERSKFDTPQFSDDGRVLLEVLLDRRLRVRRLDSPGLIEAFCAASPGNPSPAEWQRWMGSTPYQKICSE